MSISAAQVQAIIDGKTKPPGSLGKLESLALQIALAQQTDQPVLRQPHIVVFAADHGLADAGVSAFPKAVTAQMVHNFANGGAAINAFARQHQIQLVVADVGVDAIFPESLPITPLKVSNGTQNALTAPAMTAAQRQQCAQQSRSLVMEIISTGCNVIGFGEMGIGNTASASLIMSAVTGLPIADCVGRGTGLDDAGLARKIEILQQVQSRHALPADASSDDILKAVGGFEIAHIADSFLVAAAQGCLVLVDGFIATAAYALAERSDPSIREKAIFCHTSAEQGHQRLLDYLGAEPLLNLGMRLGEGSGCAVAYPLLESAVAFLNDMASFATAGVSQQAAE